MPGSNHDLIVGSTLLLVVMSIGFFGLGTVPLLRVVQGTEEQEGGITGGGGWHAFGRVMTAVLLCEPFL